MLSRKSRATRYTSIFISLIALCSVLVYPILRGETATPGVDDVKKELKLVKSELQSGGGSPSLIKRNNRLGNILSNCGTLRQIIESFGADDTLVPTSSLCLPSNSLAVTDPTFNRLNSGTTGNGFGGGVCSLNGAANAVRYDKYSFNLTGCAAFPTVVTISTCGGAGCANPGNVDTLVVLYRSVPAGDPLTANGGLQGVFNPASPCANARGMEDDQSGVAVATNGSSCNQLNTADCMPSCAQLELSGMKRSLGSGSFTVVVNGISNGTTGNYTLFVDAPAAGCVVALVPTAANATIGGQVRRSSGRGISNAIVTLSGGGLSAPVSARTSPFGFYVFPEVRVGETYVLTVSSKGHTFANPTQVITLQDNISNANFISQEP